MRVKITTILKACAIAAVALGLLYLYDNLPTNTGLDLLEDRHIGGGLFKDVSNEIGVQSIEDIQWYKDGDTWYINFGKVQLELDAEALLDSELIGRLESLGIAIVGNLDTEALRFYWFGEEIKECVHP